MLHGPTDVAGFIISLAENACDGVGGRRFALIETIECCGVAEAARYVARHVASRMKNEKRAGRHQPLEVFVEHAHEIHGAHEPAVKVDFGGGLE